MKVNIDMEKYNALYQEASNIKDIIKTKESELECVEKELLAIFPKGYWWAFDIDDHWKRPKKYTIKEVKNGYVVVKEIVKKLPWDGFTGENIITFAKLSNLDIFRTEDAAKKAAYNRICPKCGGAMGYTVKQWCDKCIDKRFHMRIEYEDTHVFYEPNEKIYYTMGYTDELTRDCDKGFGGKHFTFKRLDTGEIIESDNLWSSCSYRGDGNVPEIEFLNT